MVENSARFHRVLASIYTLVIAFLHCFLFFRSSPASFIIMGWELRCFFPFSEDTFHALLDLLSDRELVHVTGKEGGAVHQADIYYPCSSDAVGCKARHAVVGAEPSDLEVKVKENEKAFLGEGKPAEKLRKSIISWDGLMDTYHRCNAGTRKLKDGETELFMLPAAAVLKSSTKEGMQLLVKKRRWGGPYCEVVAIEMQALRNKAGASSPPTLADCIASSKWLSVSVEGKRHEIEEQWPVVLAVLKAAKVLGEEEEKEEEDGKAAKGVLNTVFWGSYAKWAIWLEAKINAELAKVVAGAAVVAAGGAAGGAGTAAAAAALSSVEGK